MIEKWSREKWYEHFKDKIEESKAKIISARGEGNITEKPLENNSFYIYIRESGYQVIPIDTYNKLSKAIKNKLDKKYILY